jgi:WD40-like Beta Propeller Repeat
VMNIERRDPAATPVARTPVTTRPAGTSAPATSAPVTSAPGTSAPGTSAPVTSRPIVTALGHPLLNTTARWELFGRGPGVLVRIQPAAGRITRTAIPDLRSSGPVFLVAGPDQVMVRPLDNVPGYLVPDGRPARELDALVNQGPVFPGPDPTRLWLQPIFDTQPVMELATFDGRNATAVIPIPEGSSPQEASSDGAGYLLFPGIGGVYDARPEGLSRITTGSLLATGPTGWLVVECDKAYRCQMVLIGRADGSRRIVPHGELNRDRRGVISPDGSTAAMTSTGPQGESKLYLLDLVSGRRRVPAVTLNPDAYDGALAFSPDSSWLFAVTADGSVAVVDPRTAAVRALGISLPPLTQLVVRPAP